MSHIRIDLTTYVARFSVGANHFGSRDYETLRELGTHYGYGYATTDKGVEWHLNGLRKGLELSDVYADYQIVYDAPVTNLRGDVRDNARFIVVRARDKGPRIGFEYTAHLASWDTFPGNRPRKAGR